MQTSSAQSTLNGLAPNLQDATGRSFSTSFSSQSATAASFHHSGAMLGLHNIQGGMNVPGMPGSLASRNSAMGLSASSGIQQQGRFTSNNIPASLSQISHGGTYGHSGVTNRGVGFAGSPGFSSSMNGVGGSIPGINLNSSGISNRIPVPGLGVSPILGNAGARITSSMGNIAGGSIGRNITSGGLSVPGLASRVSLTSNSGSGGLNVQTTNRLKSGVLQQAPQMLSMLGNSYTTSGGALSQSQIQAANNTLSSMGMLNDVNPNEMSPFDINDFPQLSGRPNSAGGSQGQSVSLRKQGLGVNSIIQPSQEFSIHNEDFPALPGFKGGNNDFTMEMHQKDQIHDNVSMMQSQHLSSSPGFHMGRSSGFNIGGSYPSPHQQQQQQQHPPSFNVIDFSPSIAQDGHLHGSDLFSSSHASFHPQAQTGLRPLNSPNPNSGMGVYNQLLQQYPSQSPSQFRLQQMPSLGQFRDPSAKSGAGPSPGASGPDRFGLLGLLSVIRLNDLDLSSLALGIDLTTLGLNLNSSDTLYKTFGSPWAEESVKGEPEFVVPPCYYAKPPPELHGFFSKFKLETLFYVFYSMPKDEAQLYAANELCSRGWFYHKEHRLWFIRVANVEPLVKTNTYERGSYHCFDPNTWDTVRKDNFVVHYDMVEKKPTVPNSRS